MKQMDTLLFQQAQSIDEIKNRLNCIETGSSCGDGVTPAENLKSDPDFINGIVDNIMTNSNLSEIIEQIDVVQNENRELRELLDAQQKTINEMNAMLLKLFSQKDQAVVETEPAEVDALELEVEVDALGVDALEVDALGLDVDAAEVEPNVELEITDR